LFEHYLSGGYFLSLWGWKGFFKLSEFPFAASGESLKKNTERSNNSGPHVGDNEDECF
jgi:hypothetical protein